MAAWISTRSGIAVPEAIDRAACSLSLIDVVLTVSLG